MAFAATMCTCLHSSMHISGVSVSMVCICMPWDLCMNMWNLFLTKHEFQCIMVKCTIAQSWPQTIYSIFQKINLIFIYSSMKSMVNTLFLFRNIFICFETIFLFKELFLFKIISFSFFTKLILFFKELFPSQRSFNLEVKEILSFFNMSFSFEMLSNLF